MQKGKPCKIKQLQQHMNYMYYIRLKEKDKLFHRLSIDSLKFGTLTLVHSYFVHLTINFQMSLAFDENK